MERSDSNARSRNFSGCRNRYRFHWQGRGPGGSREEKNSLKRGVIAYVERFTGAGAPRRHRRDGWNQISGRSF